MSLSDVSQYRDDRLRITFSEMSGFPDNFAVHLGGGSTGLLAIREEADGEEWWRIRECPHLGRFRVRGEAVAAAINTTFDWDGDGPGPLKAARLMADHPDLVSIAWWLKGGSHLPDVLRSLVNISLSLLADDATTEALIGLKDTQTNLLWEEGQALFEALNGNERSAKVVVLEKEMLCRSVSEMSIPELVEAIAFNSDMATFIYHKRAETDEVAEANRKRAGVLYGRRNDCMAEVNRRAS